MPMKMRPRTRAAAMVGALALALPAGCSGGGSGASAAATPAITAVTRDLSSYDLFVLGSTENNPGAADVYGIRFKPFAVDRITTDKRVSSLGADAQRVVVAAADQQIDELAQVSGSGELQAIPGLGRPHAFSPSLRDGVMYYQDVDDTGAKDQYRLFAWDLGKRSKKLLFQSTADFGSGKPMSGGRVLLITADKKDQDQAAIRSKSGKLTEFPLKGLASFLRPGRSLIAATLTAAGDQGAGRVPEATVLLDPATGKTTRVPGIQAIAWSPDGTQLLARRTGDLANSQLVLLDPAHPDAPVSLQTVPGLVIFNGTWVRGELAS